MKLGDSFYLTDRSSDPHNWLVLSDPSRGSLTVIANASTHDGGDPTGLPTISVGEHQPPLTLRSFVRLEKLRLVPAEALQAAVQKRVISPSHPLSPQLLSRLQRELLASPRARREAKQILNDQGITLAPPTAP